MGNVLHSINPHMRNGAFHCVLSRGQYLSSNDCPLFQSFHHFNSSALLRLQQETIFSVIVRIDRTKLEFIELNGKDAVE